MTNPKDAVYVSWDPGGGKRRSTGMVSWDEFGNEISRARLNPEQLDMVLMMLENVKTVRVFIYERYIPFGHINHTGKKLVTSECIGQLKAFARRWGIKLVEVRPEDKIIAAKWAGVKLPPKDEHLPDDVAAYLIGFYHLDKMGIIKPRVLDDDELRIDYDR